MLKTESQSVCILLHIAMEQDIILTKQTLANQKNIYMNCNNTAERQNKQEFVEAFSHLQESIFLKHV